MLEVKRLVKNQSYLTYFHEDLQKNLNVVYVPAIGANANVCVQTMIYNGFANKYAFSWRNCGLSSDNPNISYQSCVDDLTYFLNRLNLKNYLIVLEGSAVPVFYQAYVHLNVKPNKAILLDPYFDKKLYQDGYQEFNSYREMVDQNNQELTAQEKYLDMEDFQKVMMRNGFVSHYHLVGNKYVTHLSKDKYENIIMAMNMKLMRQIPTKTILLLSKNKKVDLMSHASYQKKYLPYSKIFDEAYAVDQTTHDMFTTAPVAIADFLNKA